MAPIRPASRKRTTARSRVAAKASADPRGKYAPLPDSEMAFSAQPESTDALSNLKDDYFGFDGNDFRLSKKDKRVIKHGNLLAKVREGAIEKKSRKRRRPNKKLKTDIGGLGDALPDVDDGEGEWEGIEDDGQMAVEGRKKRRRKDEGKMVMKSLKLRHGAMKRKKKMEDDEMERMQRNLALLAQGRAAETKVDGGEDGAEDAQAKRWEALRAFIGGTMQRDQAFAKT
ncbi:uncharacterized protein MYCFIDRAFT_84655 [Pseudocercospora fijiensis CIRAD86]|uniref:Ribosome biogenesis protein SLX9 n=1 Tax=Pseudocercospora fijiensis (strain CIRAD86) TaxID=383855 RepID=M3AU06_PSEFD|nr:uncharacterized protein MYCFIDRAFT_84655 [Pseudocercospora fijiensis CIRAD86]EME80633.1 hypothetical protein MYCFIDRAFT_84655 [Pseudocercospora fijiensis CIRAD86]